MPTISGYGTWASPVTTEQLVEQVVSLAYPVASGSSVYFIEGRPSQGGRQAIVERLEDGTRREVLADDFSARTLVHEYGGLSYAVFGDTVYFSNFADQRLYKKSPSGDAIALTVEPPTPMAYRYAAPVLRSDGALLICVRERHLGQDVINDLVAIGTDGRTEPVVIAEGHHFYGSPSISPDGERVAWTTWDHPNMPWDGTELWEAVIDARGKVRSSRKVTGGPSESITQPRYSPSGALHYISDRSGWWNLYAGDDKGGTNLAPRAGEFAGPDWVFGLSSYAFLDDRIACTWSERGASHLGLLNPASGSIQELETGYDHFGSLTSGPAGLLAIVGSPTQSPALIEIAIDPTGSAGGVKVLALSRQASVAHEYLSVPRPIEFPTEHGLTAHALFYPPTNPDYAAPAGELAPLIVASHGGPTAATSSVLSYQIQYWTSRGFGVVDVNYGGSSGYGRKYRQRLNGNWGVVDVDDCVNAALYLAEEGEADRDRLVIHGGSAGGYTTLCAVTFRKVFAAGASYFGVADAGALARDTHKFEARYLDNLIGPWPEAEELYRERSPIFHTDQLSTPLILFQGLEDKIVPPNQAEMMLDALRKKGAPVAYIAYEGEQHGFRRAENIKRTAEAELYFYARVFGFTPAEHIDPVQIENLPG